MMKFGEGEPAESDLVPFDDEPKKTKGENVFGDMPGDDDDVPMIEAERLADHQPLMRPDGFESDEEGEEEGQTRIPPKGKF